MNLKANSHLLLYYCAHLIQSQSKTSLYAIIIIILNPIQCSTSAEKTSVVFFEN